MNECCLISKPGASLPTLGLCKKPVTVFALPNHPGLPAPKDLDPFILKMFATLSGRCVSRPGEMAPLGAAWGVMVCVAVYHTPLLQGAPDEAAPP